ncbi:MAG: hypothetical protein JXA66_08715 [Oligoflexia bacterium]|nr:hypothetical protein [Oligoflexia bacterium]
MDLKQEIATLKAEISKKDRAIRDLEEKYRKLLVNKFSGKNEPARLSDHSGKREIKKVYIGFIPLRVVLALLLVAMAVIYVLGYAPRNDSLRAYITKGMVLPQRGIASISSLFYDRN